MRLHSQRLVLRDWQESDRTPFAEMSSDPVVMRHLLPFTSQRTSDGWIDFQMEQQSIHGFCMWAVEWRSTGKFIGSVGLLATKFVAHFTPAVEIGWRIASPFWNNGFATEAAGVALSFGFENATLQEIVAYAGADNAPSRGVMRKLGMSHNQEDDFDHPRLSTTNPHRRQVLYRMTRNDWLARPNQPNLRENEI